MILLVVFLLVPVACLAVDPFSKITVKSCSATFQKKKDATGIFCLKYKKNVHVTFADDTTISSDFLDVFVKNKKMKKLDEKAKPELDRVVFKDNVKVNRKNQKVQADKVEVFVEKKLCKLEGNVKVEQFKQDKKDIPIVAECEKAYIHWEDDEITLEGDDENPVSTTIELDRDAKFISKKMKQQKKAKKR